MTNKKKFFKNAIVEKRNVLNELRKNSMSLQELRFFTIYLSKINSRDISTRLVKFPLHDFCKIMNLNYDNAGHNIAQFRISIRRLLQQIVEVPNERGGYTAFQLFKECTIDKDELGGWFVTIDAHDKALPLMFDFKTKYFTYELWNALRLKSTNQIRMYEILKQYEKLGKRELPVQELRDLLGILPDEYPLWSNFKRKVLDSCQNALKENTDICYTYEKGKSGRGGKWLTIVFHIFKNNDYVDQLCLEEFLEYQPQNKVTAAKREQLPEKVPSDEPVVMQYEPIVPPPEPVVAQPEPKVMPDTSDESETDWEAVYGSEDMAILAEACEHEFSKRQMTLIFNILTRINIPKDENTDSLLWGREHYLREMYARLNIEAERKRTIGKEITNRFAYFRGMLEDDTYKPSAYKNK